MCAFPGSVDWPTYTFLCQSHIKVYRGKRSCHSVIVIEEYISCGGSALTTFCCTVFSRTRTEREGKTRPRKRVERDLSCSEIGHGMYNAIIFYCPFLRPHQTLIWHLHQHYTFFRLPWTVWGSQTVFLDGELAQPLQLFVQSHRNMIWMHLLLLQRKLLCIWCPTIVYSGFHLLYCMYVVKYLTLKIPVCILYFCIVLGTEFDRAWV